MVGGIEIARIASVICRHHQHVILAKLWKNSLQPSVKRVESARVSFRIASVSPAHIKVDEVGKAKSLEVTLDELLGECHSLLVRVRSLGFCKANAREDIRDLADRNRCLACSLYRLGQKNCGGLERIVASVGGACIAAVGILNVRASDNSSDTVLCADKLTAELLADTVKLLKLHNAVYLNGELKHAVSRGVDDDRILLFCLFAVIVDNRSARIGLVAKKLSSRYFSYLIEYLRIKAVRKCGERRGRDMSRYLPMSNGGILAERTLGHSCDCAEWRVCLAEKFKSVDISDTERAERGNIENSRFVQTAERMRALVTESRRIRHRACANAVKHDQKNSFSSHNFLS